MNIRTQFSNAPRRDAIAHNGQGIIFVDPDHEKPRHPDKRYVEYACYRHVVTNLHYPGIDHDGVYARIRMNERNIITYRAEVVMTAPIRGRWKYHRYLLLESWEDMLEWFTATVAVAEELLSRVMTQVATDNDDNRFGIPPAWAQDWIDELEQGINQHEGIGQHEFARLVHHLNLEPQQVRAAAFVAAEQGVAAGLKQASHFHHANETRHSYLFEEGR